MRTIRFCRLTLTGFGRFRDGVEVDFGQGLTTVILPNERGKSTMVAGLLATLYGLPTAQDPTQTGTARYLHWGRASDNVGRVEFRVDDDRFWVERDFSRHRVEYGEWRDDTPYQLWSGEHNPRARKQSDRYQDWLESLVGVKSWALFERTTFITQPLPEQRELDGDVQGLLSGTGPGVGTATKALEEELRNLTTDLRRRGFPVDGRVPREIEQLVERIADLERRRGEAGSSLDLLQPTLERMNKVERDLGEARRDLELQRGLLSSWADWRRLRDEYGRRVKSQADLERAVRDTDRLEELLQERVKDRDSYGEYARAPDGVDAGLERLSELLAARERTDKGRTEEVEAIASDETELERNRDELSGLSRWGQLGKDPVEVLSEVRGGAAGLLAEWRDLAADRGRLEDLLEAKPDILAEAAPEQLAAARDYDQVLAAAEEFRREYGELEHVLPGAADEVSLAASLVDCERDLDDKAGRLKRRERRHALISITIAGAAAGLLGWLTGMWLAALGVAAAAALSLMVFRVPARRVTAERVRVEEELGRCREQLGRCDQMLGALSSRRAAELGALAERLRRRDQARARGPQALGELRDKLGSLFDQYGDEIGTRAAEWERIRTEGESLARELDRLCRQRFNCGWRELATASPLAADGPWRDAARVMTAVGAGPDRLSEVADWLSDTSDQWWEQALADAGRYVDLAGQCRDLDSAIGARRQAVGRLDRQLDELAGEIEGLSRELAPVLASAEGSVDSARVRRGEFLDRVRSVRETEAKLGALCEAHRAADTDELRTMSVNARNAAGQALYAWESLIDDRPGLPGVEDEAEAEAAQHARLTKRRDELAAKVEGLERERDELRRRQSELEGRTPDNVAELELELIRLKAELEDRMLIADALTEAVRELAGAASDWQSRYRERLAASATRHFRTIAGDEDRAVELDASFGVKAVRDNRSIVLEQLSRGARDQLYIALRLAIADLMAGGVVLPMVFDDPFGSSDAGRLDNLRQVLTDIGTSRQLILLSHDQRLRTWGEPALISERSHRPL